MRRSAAITGALLAALLAVTGWIGGAEGSAATSTSAAQTVVPEASAPLQPQLVYGLGGSTSNAGQVLISQDGGSTWATQPKSENTPGFDIYLLGSGQTALGFFENVQSDPLTYAIVRSTDGGATWQVSKRLNSLGAPDLTVDPGGGSTAAACNDGAASRKTPSGYGGNGVFVSHDGGATWKRTLRFPCFSVAIQPGGSVLLAGTDKGQLWRSTNGGGTWHRVRRWPREATRLILFDPSSPRTVIANGGYNVFRSTDAGRTWKRVWSAFTKPGQTHSKWHLWGGGVSGQASMNWSSGRIVTGHYIRFNKSGNSTGPIYDLASVNHGRTWRMAITCGGKTSASRKPCALLFHSPPVSSGSNLLAGASTGTTALLELPRSATHWQVVPVSINMG